MVPSWIRLLTAERSSLSHALESGGLRTASKVDRWWNLVATVTLIKMLRFCLFWTVFSTLCFFCIIQLNITGSKPESYRSATGTMLKYFFKCLFFHRQGTYFSYFNLNKQVINYDYRKYLYDKIILVLKKISLMSFHTEIQYK